MKRPRSARVAGTQPDLCRNLCRQLCRLDTFRNSLLLALAALLAGCRHEAAHDHDHADAESVGAPLFENNKGIRLPPDMRHELGIDTVELTERPIHHQIEAAAQIFRADQSNRTAAAVLWLDPAQARSLTPGVTRFRAQRIRPEPVPGAPATTALLTQLHHDTTHISGQVEAILALTDPDGRWPVGTHLRISLTATRTNAVPAVPASAIIDGAQGPFVYAASGEHFVRTPVQLGAAENGFIEVTDGLYAGDVVVTRGAEALWTIELCALKGGSPCCPVPLKKGRD